MDLETINPVVPSAAISFATAEEPAGEGFFQAFLATVPKHPVLKYCLDEMVTFYVEKRPLTFYTGLHTGGMGTVTLRRAYEKWIEEMELEGGSDKSEVDADAHADSTSEAESYRCVRMSVERVGASSFRTSSASFH